MISYLPHVLERRAWYRAQLAALAKLAEEWAHESLKEFIKALNEASTMTGLCDAGDWNGAMLWAMDRIGARWVSREEMEILLDILQMLDAHRRAWGAISSGDPDYLRRLELQPTLRGMRVFERPLTASWLP